MLNRSMHWKLLLVLLVMKKGNENVYPSSHRVELKVRSNLQHKNKVKVLVVVTAVKGSYSNRIWIKTSIILN